MKRGIIKYGSGIILKKGKGDFSEKFCKNLKR